jgi:hypothetical protein
MLFGIKLLLAKSQAAVCLQKELELEQYNSGIPDIYPNPAREANQIIEVFCERYINDLEAANKREGLPHKLTLAASATAFAYEALDAERNLMSEKNKESLLFVLVKLLNKINSQDRRLREFDFSLLKMCNEVAMKLKVEKTPIPVIPDDLKDY